MGETLTKPSSWDPIEPGPVAWRKFGSVSLSMPAIRVHVSALPEDGKRTGFSGLVGSYEASASADKPKVEMSHIGG